MRNSENSQLSINVWLCVGNYTRHLMAHIEKFMTFSRTAWLFDDLAWPFTVTRVCNALCRHVHIVSDGMLDDTVTAVATYLRLEYHCTWSWGRALRSVSAHIELTHCRPDWDERTPQPDSSTSSRVSPLSVCTSSKCKTSTVSDGDWRLSTHVDRTSTGRAPIRPILGFWGSKVPQNGRFFAQDADEPPCKIWRR